MDLWDDTGDSIVERVAGVDDFEVAEATRKSTWPGYWAGFGVDADTCTGDHSCIRLSGCPSLTHITGNRG